MKTSGFFAGTISISFFIFFLIGCGQKKIEGPAPAQGDVTMRLLVLEDAKLPRLSESDLARAVGIAETQLAKALSRKVRIELGGRGDLQEFFDRLSKPFGKMAFEPRLDLSKPLGIESKSLLYSRLMDLLRNERVRPLLPAFAVDTGFSNISLILDTVVLQFEGSVQNLREFGRRSGGAFFTEATQNRRSVFAWYTALAQISQDSRPADIILTNDLLIFDALASLPSQVYATGGVTPAYTRVYPGITLVSTFPFLSDDPFFSKLRGPADHEARLNLLALAISREVGGKLILMNQDEFHPIDCLNRPWIPPFNSALEHGGASLVSCSLKHKPLDRQQLLFDYLLSHAQISVMIGRVQEAESAIQRLIRMAPEDQAVRDLQAFVHTVRMTQKKEN